MKSLITRVLLATDFSPCAAHALECALAVTSSWKAELHLHCMCWSSIRAWTPSTRSIRCIWTSCVRMLTGNSSLEKHAAESGISIRKRIEFGIPSQRIEHVAKNNRPISSFLVRTAVPASSIYWWEARPSESCAPVPVLSSPLRPAGYLQRDLRLMPRIAQSSFAAYWFLSTSPNVL